jgi:hypothetical protein
VEIFSFCFRRPREEGRERNGFLSSSAGPSLKLRSHPVTHDKPLSARSQGPGRRVKTAVFSQGHQGLNPNVHFPSCGLGLPVCKIKVL